MSDRSKWSFLELESLSTLLFAKIIDEIPSDYESVVSTDGSNDDALFDIEAMDIDILEAEIENEKNGSGAEATMVIDNNGWETEDEMPMSNLQLQSHKLTTTWTNDITA
ncbi:hypothetical protein NQ314_005370 [Rhamnusium bicolor]|uniref:Uncharacterized protein n=1 Tax=Rhamnusium bicolor TaxID=1586634 RepID=A0AAV8ZJK0_9CUCU|nr:hypothetical protein NQ314_005370 [Rhamnusium bicolor]